MNLVNICENRRRWRSDEEVGGVTCSNWSSENWNLIPNPIKNRFMILLWMEKMKNWLQFYQNILFWWIGETKKIKLLFIVPLREIIFQLVNFLLIWELICSLMEWLRIYSVFIVSLSDLSFVLVFSSSLLWRNLSKSRNHQTPHWKNSSSLSLFGSNLWISHNSSSKQIFPIHPW